MSTSFDVASSTDGCVIQPAGELKVYFAHPVTSYGTQAEADVLEAIAKWIGHDTVVVNPNTEEHQTNYKNRVTEQLATNFHSANPFNYFLELAMSCNFCVFLPFDDRRIGSGVMAEIQTFFDSFGSEARVYEWIPVDNLFRMRDISYFEKPGRVLTLEETRERINQLRTKP